MQLPITNGFYESASLPISAQECTNWYVSAVLTEGLAQQVLFGTPGIDQIATTGIVNQSNRGSFTKGGIPYFVNGTTLYRVDITIALDKTETFAVVSLGTVSGTNKVFMRSNDNQLMIVVPGGNGYIYDETAGTPFLQITDLDFSAFGEILSLVSMDKFFIVSTDEKALIASGPNDGLSWNALDVTIADSDPNSIEALIEVNSQLYVVGSQVTSVYNNQGASVGFPFTQLKDYEFDKGCFAPQSIVALNQTFLMIGGGVDESPAVWQFSGNGYRKISTPAIDALMDSFTREEVSNAFSWAYGKVGSGFVGFTIANRTIVYDLATGLWHERKSVKDEIDARWRVNSMTTAYGDLLVADNIDGRIGILDNKILMEYGEEIRRVVSSPNFSDGLNSRRVSMIELTVESGVGNSDRPDPVITMDISDDGGKTFTYQRARKIGKIGETTKRAIWYKNGRFSRFRILRFRLSDPVKAVIIRLDAKIV